MGYIENLRAAVGNQPLILVGVAVAVLNETGEILLQKRMDGLWGVPGGFIELGESTEDAGRREVLEETGIEIGKLDLVGVLTEFGDVSFCRLQVRRAYSEKSRDSVLMCDTRFFPVRQEFRHTSCPVDARPAVGQYIG